VISLLVIVLAALAQASEPAPAAPQGSSSTTLTLKGADLQLLGSVREISKEVQAIRGQKFDRPPVAVRTPDHMREVAATIRALNVLRRDRLDARGRAWADLGLGAPSSPETLYIALAADLAGIGFDPDGNRLLVAPDRLTVDDFAAELDEGDGRSTVLMETGVRVDEPVLCHLLMHVRQRERAGGDSLAETTDALLARSAWAEGEANLVAIRYLFAGMGLADGVLEESLDLADVLDGILVPTIYSQLSGSERGLVSFVYDEGYATTVEVFRSGGWEALDKAIVERQTTRDVIHRDRKPSKVDPCETHPPSQAVGLNLIDQDTLGEQAIFVLVSTLTGKDNLALQAGDGWAGDRLYRWESGGEGHAGVTLWVTRWNGEESAKDFDYAIVRTLAARFPERPPITLEGGERVIQTSGHVYRLRREGREVRFQVSSREFDSLPPGAVAGPS
jgi:hypothetical protein